MAFVKLVKNKAYFMRYQTKFKRRREGKTDYYARKRLVLQDKDKYNTPKYRLVGRITSTRVIAQVVSATVNGDRVFAQADSRELKKWGLTAGLSSYSAAYATGLLLARRLLKKVGLDTTFTGIAKADGSEYKIDEVESERRPFRAILDVGLRATTNGSKIFAVLKGATDGGLAVPHSTKKYPGTKADGDTVTENAKVHRERIVGAHIDKYMNTLKKDKARFELQFSKWAKTLAEAKVDSVEKLFVKIHDEIRKNPDFAKKAVKQNPKRDFTKKLPKRLTGEQRNKNVQKRIEIALKQASKKK